MHIPLKKAIWIITLSTVIISGSATLLLIYYKYIKMQRLYDPKYAIEAIVHASLEKEPLKTTYFAELFNLSIDQPTNIYEFNKESATLKLLKSPLIKRAEVKKIYPGTLHIHYALRVPIAFLVDYTNTAIDKEGVPIPFKPFFTPKILPEIYLGLEEKADEHFFGKRLKNKRILLALKLLDYLSKEIITDAMLIKRIDVSKSDASSYGRREIVVILEEKKEKINNGFPSFCHYLRILRLSDQSYEQELKNYKRLAKFLMQKESLVSLIVDLRIPHLAFINELLN